mmetsp:Transcript_44938/g.43515  ORF Transcript_44938/g.43515 Transcript_44938/m.43515 type:complete len:107 (+) Transcript_44938:865-1185(+)
MPLPDLENLMKQIAIDIGYNMYINEYGYYTCLCICSVISSDLMNLHFYFLSGIKYSMAPDQYIIDGSEFDDPNTCSFGFYGVEDNNAVILGLSFLENYYVVLDTDS